MIRTLPPLVKRHIAPYHFNMNQTINPPVRMKQRRSIGTLDRLLDAAEDVIREEGLAGLTITQVVKRAHSSVGAFYRRFTDRDALLYAVQKRNHTRAQQLYNEHLARLEAQSLPLVETLEQMFYYRAHMIMRDAPILHAFVVQEALGSAFREEGRRFFAYCRSSMRNLVLRHSDEISHPQPELAAELVCRTWLALMEQIVLYGATPFDTEAQSSDIDVLVAEFTRAMTGYLRCNVDDGQCLPLALSDCS
jgi:AcrR family transcriptional regulator